MYDGDTFKVTIHVEIAKDRQGSYGSEQAISYDQEFRIPAVGWADVSKIMANLDKAVGDIQRKYTVKPSPTGHGKQQVIKCDDPTCSVCGHLR